MLRGLPASGKSTWAREQVEKSGGNIKRVNKDDLRAMLDNSKWSKRNEKFVLDVRDIIVAEALDDDLTVIVDDTGFNPIHKTTLQDIADTYGAGFQTKFFDVGVEECIARDSKREKPVGRSVIVSMAEKYLGYVSKPKTQYVAPQGATEAIIVDIDGTLAHGIGKTRKPYEWHKVYTDTVDPIVRDLVVTLSQTYDIILMSGRDSSCRDLTVDWLKDHDIPYDALYMRAQDDNRDDRVVKRELFDTHVKDNYDVRFVLDDRDRAVQMWRNDLGLKVLQVAEGNF